MKWKLFEPFESEEKSMETETATWPEFPNVGKTTPEQILGWQDKKTKEQDCENHSQGSEWVG